MKLPMPSSFLIPVTLLLCSAAISVMTMKSQKLPHFNDITFCYHLCRHRDMYSRSPCDIRRCRQLQKNNHNALEQMFSAMRTRNLSYEDRYPMLRQIKPQKRVKEVWEGPAPADINH